MTADLDTALGQSGQGREPRLLDRVREALRLRHCSRRTEDAYVTWMRRFIVFQGKRHQKEMRHTEIAAFLSSLAVSSGVSASTQNQAASALVFSLRTCSAWPSTGRPITRRISDRDSDNRRATRHLRAVAGGRGCMDACEKTTRGAQSQIGLLLDRNQKALSHWGVP